MKRVGTAMIGTVVLIGLVRLLSYGIKGFGVLDVVGSAVLSLGIAVWVWYIIKNRARL
jgi:hypothetical protein